MESYFSISEAAKIVGLTSETLRHYDRIDLVKPCKKDQWSGYRYYSEQEIVRLNTIQALRCMDLSLKEIKKVLEYDNLEEIVEFLKRAEQKANQKIEQLKYAKSKIQLARADYEKKQNGKQMHHDIFYQQIDERVILLSNSMQEPTLSNLWNYHSHFYQQTNDLQKQNYLFEDLAGIYTKDPQTLSKNRFYLSGAYCSRSGKKRDRAAPARSAPFRPHIKAQPAGGNPHSASPPGSGDLQTGSF